MTYFWKIFRFAKPYSKYMALNIFFNVLYAFFNAFSFLVLMPMLEVLFGENRQSIPSRHSLVPWILKPMYPTE